VRLGRSGPLDAVVERQLDLFAVDEADLLEEAAEAEDAWNRSNRDGAEEAYGDYQLVVDAIADRLLEIREAYASTLDERLVETYRAAFGRAARRRYKRYASLLADLDDPA
jgi:hypothetical protein